MKDTRLILAIALLCFGFLLLSKCRDEKIKTTTTTKVVVRHDTILRFTQPLPRLLVFQKVPQEVDTAAIIADYYATRKYHDTVVNLPEAVVQLTEEVSQNQIIDRKVHVTTNERIISHDVNHDVYLNGSMGAAPSLGILVRNRNLMVGAGWDFINKGLKLDLAIRLKKW